VGARGREDSSDSRGILSTAFERFFDFLSVFGILFSGIFLAFLEFCFIC